MFDKLRRTLLASAARPRVTAVTPGTYGSAAGSDALAESAAFLSRGDKCLAEGKLDDAAECYRQAVSANPANGEAYCSLGMICLEQDAYPAAEDYLKQAIAADPELAQAYYFLGTAYLKQGKAGAAVESLTKARDLKPDAEVVYRDLCFALSQSGRNEAAKGVIMEGLAVNPNFGDFHFFLGNLHLQENEVGQAITCYEKTVALNPEHYGAWVNSGKLHQEQGRLNEALTCFQKALAIEPGIEIYDHLWRIYQELGRPDEVVASLLKALALRPDSPEIYYNLGLASKLQGKLDDAIAYYSKAAKLKPDFAVAYLNLANVFFEQNRHDHAETCYRKALQIEPNLALACFGLGLTLVAKSNHRESVACFRRLLQLEPGHVAGRMHLFHQLQQMCEWEDWDASVQAARQIAFVGPFSSLSIPGMTGEEQKHCAEEYTHAKFQALSALRDKLGFEFNRSPSERIRIGYLSADFRAHPVAFLMAEIFELHDRKRFHITAYSYGPDDGSAMRKRIEAAFDNFVDIRSESFEDAAKAIYADHIDVLVDLTGYTENCRGEIPALRPAPVQVNYLGYPGTMGAAFMDYMIADRFTVPAEMKQHYTEKIVWMPDCFQANDRSRPRPEAPTRANCDLPEDAVVFCCFNQTFKITPEFFDVWCRLLRAVPGSILWVPASTPQVEENLRREAASRGVEGARIIVAPLMHREGHLARLQCADLFLDTLPFNAGTTCSDALWMGLPVITCAGDAFASRMAGSLLTALGVPELITYNVDDYYHLALDLATDRNKLRAIRSKIVANRDTMPLFDSKRFTRNLEQAYTDMMQEFFANQRASLP